MSNNGNKTNNNIVCLSTMTTAAKKWLDFIFSLPQFFFFFFSIFRAENFNSPSVKYFLCLTMKITITVRF